VVSPVATRLFRRHVWSVSLLEWLFVVRQTGEQYTLHFTPVIVLGLTALAATVLIRSRGGYATIVGGSVLFLA
jgi:hypothetical protein